MNREYDYEAAPHLISLLVGESNWTINNASQLMKENPTFLSRFALCSFFLGRAKGHSQALHDFVYQNETCDMIYVFVKAERAKELTETKNMFGVKYISITNYRRIDDVLRWIPYNKIGVFFDECDRDQVQRICDRLNVIRNKIEFIVSVGEM